MTTHSLLFGPFRLLPDRRQLFEGEKEVRLGSRALDILVVLAERAGQLVSNDEIVSLVWPDTRVEDANLRVHIGALRRVLGDGRAGTRYISNVPGRGYTFVAGVKRLDAGQPSGMSRRSLRQTTLPSPLGRIVGRGLTISTLAEQLPARRFLTIVGPGGIGKTTVALAIAEQIATRYEHGAHFIDFAKLVDGKLIANALAAGLGIQVYADDPLQGVLGHLTDQRALIVLDNCEHLIEEAAGVAEALFQAAPGSHILATSREPLRAAGEWVHRLGPLSSPPPGNALSATEALTYPAVQLFIERSMSSSNAFELSDEDTQTVAEICRRLDGIPLAIELAAATVDLFGVRGLAARLDDRLSLLTRGRRTALPRHQTLRAMLDWSYEILPQSEQTILRRLAVFVGTFTLDCASAVAASDDVSVHDAVERLSNLVAKSLITADVAGELVRYRLLETTREYALEKLRQSHEAHTIFRRHADYYSRLLRDQEQLWYESSGKNALNEQSIVDNVRTALSWAFSEQGDVSIGITLAAAAAPLWMCLSSMAECRRWTQQALATGRVENLRCRMQLATALGFALTYTKGAADDTRAALEAALSDAEALGDLDYQLRALWALSVVHLNNGLFRQALEVAERLYQAAERSHDRCDLPIGDRMIAFSLHYLGDETQARRRLERMLSRYPCPTPPSHMVRFQFDLRLTAQLILAEILWIQGHPDRAVRLMSDSIEEAVGHEHTITLCNALAKAIPIALLAGDLAAAERYISMLLEESTRNSLVAWQAEGRCFLAVLSIRIGNVPQGVEALRKALDDLPGISFSLRYTALLGELAEAYALAGQFDDGMAAIDTALERSDRHEERWYYPELLRIKGGLVLCSNAPDAVAAATQYYDRALEAASRQDALSWQLRAAMSLTELQRLRGEGSNASDMLRSVHARFEEGFATADLRKAASLLETAQACQ